MSLLTLPFAGTVAAGGELTLVSKVLRFPYTIRSLHTSFALGTDRTLQVHFFRSPDSSTPTSGQPSGHDLLTPYGQVSYLVGDDEQKVFPHEIPVLERNTFLKVYAKNTDVFDHTVDAQIIIDTTAISTETAAPAGEAVV